MPNQSISEAPTFFSNFEFEDEREQENEAFSNSEYEQGAYFIGEIAKVAKSIAKEAKRYAPSVVQALLKLIPKTLSPDASPGKLSYAMIQEGEMEVAQKQSEFFGSNELEVEVSDHEVAHEAALTEFFADQAAEAATESEAEFLIGATLPMTTSIMGAKRGLRSVMPAIAQASAYRTRLLTQQGTMGQQLLRAVPMFDRLAIAALKSAARSGQPINSATAIKAMAAATDRVLNNPELLEKAIAQNLLVRQKTAPTLSQQFTLRGNGQMPLPEAPQDEAEAMLEWGKSSTKSWSGKPTKAQRMINNAIKHLADNNRRDFNAALSSA
ncbi:MAG: hypothetical protein C4287_16290, partial [Leptolyngbya sp. ERB_1_2]